MKITNTYYVLVHLGTDARGIHLLNRPETEFIYPKYEIGTEIEHALRCVNLEAAQMVLEDYEHYECGDKSSGFAPLFVTREYTF